MRTLLLADLAVGLAAGAVAFGLRFGDQVTAYNRWLSAAVRCCCRWRWSLVLAVNRAYERRFLFVGTDEYQRVIRAGARR